MGRETHFIGGSFNILTSLQKLCSTVATKQKSSLDRMLISHLRARTVVYARRDNRAAAEPLLQQLRQAQPTHEHGLDKDVEGHLELNIMVCMGTVWGRK